MDINFKELLNIADYNKTEAKDEASVKRYSISLPPPKKVKKSGVESEGVRRFLAKKAAEEAAKAAEARKQKEQLLSIRSQNSKNNKKAKIMASRTKDNDFSRIKLTEDEIVSKKKIEMELQRKHLNDKVERMKCRIELEEKEKLLPRKRKRKSKNGEMVDESHIEQQAQERIKELKNFLKESDPVKDKGQNPSRKPQRPAPPPMSFHELLKVAEVKQYEPVVIPIEKKKEGKLLTKKERRIFEEEQARIQRQKERKIKKETTISKSSKHSSDKKNSEVERTNIKKPVVIRVEKDSSSQARDESHKFKIPKASTSLGRNIPIPKSVDKNRLPSDKLPKPSSSLTHKLLPNHPSKIVPIVKSQAPKLHTNHDREKYSKVCVPGEKPQAPKLHTNYEREKSKNPAQIQKSQVKSSIKSEDKVVFKKPEKLVPKKNGIKIAPATVPVKEVPTIDTDAIAAAIEKRIREKIEKEMEEKLAAKFASQFQNMKTPPVSKPTLSKPPEKVKHVNGTHAAMNGKSLGKLPDGRPVPSKKEGERISKPSLNPRPPPPKPFHPNPYLDPPRRRLDPQRPQRPMKRKIESDDEDDDEDDMSDFIDDGPSQNDEDYSKYIKEIFGYDRNRYVDDDDDDIVESSFVEQMKEETRSAKLGYLEDLEEERKLREMEKKRKMKMKMKK